MLTYNYIGGVVEDYDTAFISNVKNLSGNWTVEMPQPQQHFGGSHCVWEITWSCPGALAKSGSSHRWSPRSEKDGEDTIVCTLSWPYDFVKQCLHCSVKHKSSCLDEKYRFMRNLSEYQHSFLTHYVHASEQQCNVETIFILNGSCILKQAKGHNWVDLRGLHLSCCCQLCRWYCLCCRENIQNCADE